MSKKLREQYIKQPPQVKDESHAGNPKHGPAICSRCRSYYDKRSWKHPTDETWSELSKDGKRKIQFVLCPACKEIQEHLFEGEVVVERIPPPFVPDLLRLVHNFAEKAEAHSTEHRLIRVSGDEKKMVIMTTENQLAGRLARKIMESFKNHASLKITFSREPYEKESAHVVFAVKEKVALRML